VVSVFLSQQKMLLRYSNRIGIFTAATHGK